MSGENMHISRTIHPTYYRSRLPVYLQKEYRRVVHALLHKRKTTWITPSITSSELASVIYAVHHDHPEFFYIYWWQTPLYMGSILQFQYMLEDPFLSACQHTIRDHANEIRCEFSSYTPKLAFRKLANKIAKEVTYKDTGSGFYDHTLYGALKQKSAVCEGISKLFLFYCQHLRLPAILVSGTVNGVGHAWCLVEYNGVRRHIDITAQLSIAEAVGTCSPFLFKTDSEMLAAGYQWDTTLIPATN